MQDPRYQAAARRTLRDVAWNLPALAITKGRGIVLLVVLARLLGVEQYGVWVQVNVVANMVGMLAGLGLYQAIIQFHPEATEPSARAEVVWNALGTVAAAGLILGIALWVGKPMVSRALTGTDAWASAFAWGGTLGALGALRLVLFSYYRAQDRIRAFSTLGVAADAVDVVLVVAAALAWHSVTGTVAASAVGTAFVVAAVGMRVVTGVGPPRFSAARLHTALRYSLPIVPTQLGDEALARGDRLLVGALLGPAATGVYSAAYTLVGVPHIVNVALTNVLFPKMTTRQWGPAATRTLWRRSTVAFLIFSIASLAILVPASQPLLRFLVGPATPLPSIRWIVLLVGLGVTLFDLGRLLSLDLYVRRETMRIALIWGASAALNLVLNVALLPTMGLLGAAVATLAAYLVFAAWIFAAVQPPVTMPAPPGA